jgi:hypothetical protein
MTMANKLKISHIGLCATLFVLAQPGRAQNDSIMPDQGPCEMRLTVDNSVDWRGAYGRGYDVFDGEPSFEVVNLTVEQTGQPCEFFLTANPIAPTNAPELQGPDGRLSYDVLQSTNGPSFLSQDFTGTETSRLEGRFAGGRGAHGAALYLAIPTGQFVRGGTYQGQVIVRLFRRGSNGPELVAEAPFAILAEVPPVLKVRFDGEGEGMRGAQIDLGDISEPQSQRLGFQVASNTDVHVTFESDNNGKLMHTIARRGVTYALMFQGKPIDLTGGNNRTHIDNVFGRDARYAELSIDVQKGDRTPLAGEYSDRLTITFTAD